MITKHGYEYFQLKEEKKLYPPKFVITVRRSRTAEDSHVDFTFQGATQEIVKRISLNITKGIMYIVYTCQMLLRHEHLRSSYCCIVSSIPTEILISY